MKRKLVRLFFKLGWHRLAHRISPSLYFECVGQRFAQECIEAVEAMAAFMRAVTAVMGSEVNTDGAD